MKSAARTWVRVVCPLLSIAGLAGCSGSTSATVVADDAGADSSSDSAAVGAIGCGPTQMQAVTAAIASKADQAAADPAVTNVADYTLWIASNDGHTLSHSHKNATASTVYESASTLMAAVVRLVFVVQTILTLVACVQSFFTPNSATATAAGTQFDYSGTLLQVAGLMAMKASGKASWTEIFDA